MDVLTGLDEAEPLRLAASQWFFFFHASSAIFDFGFHFFLVPTIPPKQLQQWKRSSDASSLHMVYEYEQ